MKLLTEDAVVTCDHVNGIVSIVPSQDWVRIGGRRILVSRDPEGRPIKGCPNIGVGIKPCTLTLPVKTGYSAWIRIDGKRICLDTLQGLTDGTPPGVVDYTVRSPGQSWMEEKP